MTDDEIAWRRLGPGYEKPCVRPDILECARYTCQVRNRCRYDNRLTLKGEGALRGALHKS